MNNKKPSLHKQSNNSSFKRNTRKPSLNKGAKNSYGQNRGSGSGNQSDFSRILLEILSIIISLIGALIVVLKKLAIELIPIIKNIIIHLKKNPKLTRNICGIAIILLIIFLVMSSFNNTNDVNEKPVPSTLIGNNSIGTVYKEGPYGNEDSDVSIAYILGVHPREQGAHRLMEQALKEKADNLNYSYYLYKINVSSDSTDYESSRMNGQTLAQEFAVPDMINNNISFAVDVHYSNGNWGVSRFIFTPRENNTQSKELADAICNNFEWMTYYVPPNPTSPNYVTGPLNDGGVPAIIYEAYTEDANNLTLQHDREIIDFIDNWNFTNEKQEKPFIFF